MIYEKEIIRNRLLDIFQSNNHLIFDDWLSSVKHVIKNQHKFKEIHDRYNTLHQVKYEVECCYNI